MSGKSRSSSSQTETNTSNVSTITDIRGGIGVTGQDAVNLVAVAGQIGNTLAATSASVAQQQLQAASAGSNALAQASQGLTKAVADLAGSQDSLPEIVTIVGIGAALVFGAFIFIRR